MIDAAKYASLFAELTRLKTERALLRDIELLGNIIWGDPLDYKAKSTGKTTMTYSLTGQRITDNETLTKILVQLSTLHPDANTQELLRQATNLYAPIFREATSRPKIHDLGMAPVSWPHTDAPIQMPPTKQDAGDPNLPLVHDLSNIAITGGEQACMIGHAAFVHCHDVRFQQGVNTKWLVRAYDLAGSEFHTCSFSPNTHVVEGHGLYANLNGRLTITDSDFLSIAGNGIQLVRRPSEQGASTFDNVPPYGPALGSVNILDISFFAHDTPSQRCSYSLAYYGCGQDLRVLNYHGGELRRGLIVVEPEPVGSNGGTWWQDTPQAWWPTRHLKIIGASGSWIVPPDREVIRLGSVEDTDIDGLSLSCDLPVESYKIKIDDYQPGDLRRLSGPGRIRGVEADAPVRVLRGKETLSFDVRGKELTWKK